MVDNFSGIGGMFARYLTEHFITAGKEAPILGMIQSAFGGSSIEAWIKSEEGEHIWKVTIYDLNPHHEQTIGSADLTHTGAIYNHLDNEKQATKGNSLPPQVDIYVHLDLERKYSGFRFLWLIWVCYF